MKHVEGTQLLQDTANRLGIALSPDQTHTLLRFESILRERAVPGGLIASSDLPRIRERHILDSLRAVAEVGPEDAAAFDLGSGAGLPGIVVAIAVPALSVTLVESRRRRAGFLDLAVGELGLRNAAVAEAQIEELQGKADVAFARALAPLPQAWLLARPLLRPGGRLIYFAGERTTVPSVVARAASVEVRSSTVLERAGPLAIMAR